MFDSAMKMAGWLLCSWMVMFFGLVGGLIFGEVWGWTGALLGGVAGYFMFVYVPKDPKRK